jgi:hypothetical protein
VLPSQLTIHDCALCLDGGTVLLGTTDEAGQKRSIMLVQHAFPQTNPIGWVPGRLYLDDDVVPIRSPLEANILALLRAATILVANPARTDDEPVQLAPNGLILGEDIRQVFSRGPEENIRALLAQIIQFVDSEGYLRFAERVEQASDETRYTAWLITGLVPRNHVIVRLGRLLGIGMRAAREKLEGGTPVATELSALEVSDLAARYSAEGLGLRVAPPFPWRLDPPRG